MSVSRLGTSLRVSILGFGLLSGLVFAQEPTGGSSATAERVEAELSGRIRVGGSILDGATGKPLVAVRLTGVEGSFDAAGGELRTTRRFKEEVTGAFRFECGPCTDVRLRFSKPGYRSETLRFAAATADGNFLDETRLRVTLRPLEDPVVLSTVQGELLAGPEERAKVLAFGSEGRRARPEKLQQLRAKAGEMPPILRLVADIGADGKARTVDVVEPKAAGVPVAPKHARPTRAALDFSALGGVIRHETDGSDSNPRAVLRSMRRAPAEGYSDGLELGSTLEPVFFYCKIGERYGKGWVEAPWIDHDGHVRAHVRLWLNDGGQSLEAAYD